MSLLALVIGLVLMVRVLTSDVPPQTVFIVLPLFAPALYLHVRRLLVEGHRTRMFYGITDRRILVYEQGAAITLALRTFDLATLPSPFLGSDVRDGHGTLYLDPRSIPEKNPESGLDRPVDPYAPPALIDIPNVRVAHQRIIEARTACLP